MFTIIVFEILLFKGRSVIGLVQQVPGIEKANFQLKNKKNQDFAKIVWKVIGGWRLRMAFKLFNFALLFQY